MKIYPVILTFLFLGIFVNIGFSQKFSLIYSDTLCSEKIYTFQIRDTTSLNSKIDSVYWYWNDTGLMKSKQKPTFRITKYFSLSGIHSVKVIRFRKDSARIIKDSATFSMKIFQGPQITLLTNPAVEEGFVKSCTNKELNLAISLKELPPPNYEFAINWGMTDTLVKIDDFSTAKNNIYPPGSAFTLKLFSKDTTNHCERVDTVFIITGPPNVTYERTEIVPSCQPKREGLKLNIPPFAGVGISFGDSTFLSIKALKYRREDTLVSHTYITSSCGKDVLIGSDTICKDCFVITISATNVCGPSITVIAPIRTYDKPYVNGFEVTDPKPSLNVDTLTHFCSGGEFTFLRNSSRGTAPIHLGMNECFFSDTITFSFKDLSPSKNDTTFTSICDGNKCDTIYHLKIEDGQFLVSVKQANLCGESIFSKKITVAKKDTAKFEPVGYDGCMPVNIFFKYNQSPDITDFYWNFGDGSPKDASNVSPTHRYDVEGEFKVTHLIQNKYNCQNQYDTVLSFKYCENMYIPNAFIPDSRNEKIKVLRPIAAKLREYNIEIFTSWGELLWKSAVLENGVPAEGWDGTYQGRPCPQGVYIWKAEATFDDGTTGGKEWKGENRNGKYYKVGSFTLIR